MQFRVLIAVTSVAGMPINQQSSTQSPISEYNDVVDYESDETAETFLFADKDGDAEISKVEFKTFLGENLTGFFYVFDTDHSGTIDFSEFFDMVELLRMEEFSAEKIAAFEFPSTDKDGDGKVSKEELRIHLDKILTKTTLHGKFTR